jgi:TonB family protein
MLLLAASFAQDSAPIVLTNHGVCHGKASDAPGCITLPRVTHDRGPDYPEEERQLRHHGTVILQVVVGPDGLPSNIGVLRTLGPKFDDSAIAAVKKWRFSPAMKDGKPVAVQIKVEVNFHLYR